jgi:LuxR family transcriptional regulator, maltose regulon positive regulatory protein
VLHEIDDILRQRPALGTLTGQVGEFRSVVAKAATAAACPSPLTPAELRLLPYLQTHLTSFAIAERLFVSRETVKSEISSIYRKLGVSSRDDAVQQATAIGLLDA